MNLNICVSVGRRVVCCAFTPLLALLTASIGGPCQLQAAKSPKPSKQYHVPAGVSASDWQSIRAAHEAWKHAIEPTKGGWQARNPAQQWTTTFDGRGFESKPHNAEWMWGLELRSYGAGDERREVKGTPKVKTEGHRLAYHWDDTVQEWYVNDGRGLEHGFSVQERPPGPIDAPLTFVLATRGPLRAAVTGDARAVDYRDASGKTVLTYSGLRVYDADGRELEARFAPAKDGVALHVDAKDARYPLLIDPVAQQAYLKASNAEANDSFGYSVAISGDVAVVGAPGEDSYAKGVNGIQTNNGASNSGAAYVFSRSGEMWTQQAYLKASNPGADDGFGTDVAIDGSVIAVGAPGEDSNAREVDGIQSNDLAKESGAVYVFVRRLFPTGLTTFSLVWSQQAYLKALNAAALHSFGSSVAVSGTTVVVGAFREGGDQGSAYVFLREGGTKWSQQAHLKASNPGAFDWFGYDVDIHLDAIVVGAPMEDSNAKGVNGSQSNDLLANSGAAYAFTRSGTKWSQLAYLKASNPGKDDSFGSSVAVSGTGLVVGAPREDSNAKGVDGTQSNDLALDSGAAYVFTRGRAFSAILGGGLSNWSQEGYLKASNTGPGNRFGTAVDIDGTTAVIGAPIENSSAKGVNGSETNSGAVGSGAAYVFLRGSSGTPLKPLSPWKQQAYLKALNAEAQDNFGAAVAVSDGAVLAGANREDGDGNKSLGSGAAYVFAGLGAAPSFSGSTSASGQVGTPFSYAIKASGTTPTSYSATGLPAGLILNGATGIISGTPTQPGLSSVSLSFANATGSGKATLSIDIKPGGAGLAITSALTAKATLGAAFNYKIEVQGGTPTSFGAEGLPSGLELNAATGVITGASEEEGDFPIDLSATAGSVTVTVSLQLTVEPPAESSSDPGNGGDPADSGNGDPGNSPGSGDQPGSGDGTGGEPGTNPGSGDDGDPGGDPDSSGNEEPAPEPIPDVELSGSDDVEPVLQTNLRPIPTNARNIVLKSIVVDDRTPVAVRFRVKPPGGTFGQIASTPLPGEDSTKLWRLKLGLPKEGTWEIQAFARDAARNQSFTETLVIVVDRTKPSLRISSSPQASARRYVLRGSISDNHQTANLRFRLKEANAKRFGPWRTVKLPSKRAKQAFAQAVILPKIGQWQIQARAVDAAGNASLARTIVVHRTK